MRIYIGYEPREVANFDICAYSIARHASSPIEIVRLDREELRSRYLYFRENDGAATSFAFTRFLCPYLSKFGGDPCIFVDCDFIFTVDPYLVMKEYENRFAVSVVQHPPYTPVLSVKMDGQKQEAYPRKNWSSFMLFNPAHISNRCLTPELISTATGAYLHRFEWLRDEDIGRLSPTWNYLADEGLYPYISKPYCFHSTNGCPCLGPEPCNQNCELNELWHEYHSRMLLSDGSWRKSVKLIGDIV